MVGGGPTGVEVAGEVVDFVDKDIRRLYPELSRDMKVTLVEANEILASFDVRLREYTAQHLQRSGVKLVKVPSVLLLQSGDAVQLLSYCWHPYVFGLCCAHVASTAHQTCFATLRKYPGIQVETSMQYPVPLNHGARFIACVHGTVCMHGLYLRRLHSGTALIQGMHVGC